jgi:hypothetical protein
VPIDALDALIGTPYGSRRRPQTTPAGGYESDVGALVGALGAALGRGGGGLQYADPGVFLSLMGQIEEERARDEALAREEALRAEETAMQQQQMGQQLSQLAVEQAQSGAPRSQVQTILGALGQGLPEPVTSQAQGALGALYPQEQLGPRVTGLSPASGLIPSKAEMAEIRDIVGRGINNGDSEEDILSEVATAFEDPEVPQAGGAARSMGKYVYDQWSQPGALDGGGGGGVGVPGPMDALNWLGNAPGNLIRAMGGRETVQPEDTSPIDAAAAEDVPWGEALMSGGTAIAATQIPRLPGIKHLLARLFSRGAGAAAAPAAIEAGAAGSALVPAATNAVTRVAGQGAPLGQDALLEILRRALGSGRLGLPAGGNPFLGSRVIGG